MPQKLSAAVAFLLLVACSGPGKRDLAHHMNVHFAHGTLAQTAVITGDLVAARRHGKQLYEHDREGLSANAVRPMRQAAQALSEASSLVDAAGAVGRIGAACGQCHQATGSRPGIESQIEPSAGATLPSRMARHQWAADRMWEGLVNPSDESWIRGAEVLLEAPLGQAEIPGFGGSRAAQMGERVHQLANRARSQFEPAERASLYGELLSTCSVCHAAFRD